jgi:hypothetical protein
LFCNKCGKKIPDNSLFCPACGNKIWTDAENNDAEKTGIHQADENIPVIDLKNKNQKEKNKKQLILSVIISVLVIVIGIFITLNINKWDEDSNDQVNSETYNNPIYLGKDISIHSLSDNDIGKVYYVDAGFWTKTDYKNFPYSCMVKEMGDQFATSIYVKDATKDKILESCRKGDQLFFKAVYENSGYISENTKNEHLVYYFEVIECTYANNQLTSDTIEDAKTDDTSANTESNTGNDVSNATSGSNNMNEPIVTIISNDKLSDYNSNRNTYAGFTDQPLIHITSDSPVTIDITYTYLTDFGNGNENEYGVVLDGNKYISRSIKKNHQNNQVYVKEQYLYISVRNHSDGKELAHTVLAIINDNEAKPSYEELFSFSYDEFSSVSETYSSAQSEEAHNAKSENEVNGSDGSTSNNSNYGIPDGKFSAAMGCFGSNNSDSFMLWESPMGNLRNARIDVASNTMIIEGGFIYDDNSSKTIPYGTYELPLNSEFNLACVTPDGLMDYSSEEFNNLFYNDAENESQRGFGFSISVKNGAVTDIICWGS